MPNHKLTLLGHPARKKVQQFLQSHPTYFENEPQRRLAYADGPAGDAVLAMSGEAGVILARQYEVDLTAKALHEQFRAMLQNYGFTKEEKWDADACAEAHLWMTLFGIHQKYVVDRLIARHRMPHPRHAHAWVYEIDGHNRPKEDSPCRNCRQWVRKEFCTVNGTA